MIFKALIYHGGVVLQTVTIVVSHTDIHGEDRHTRSNFGGLAPHTIAKERKRDGTADTTCGKISGT